MLFYVRFCLLLAASAACIGAGCSSTTPSSTDGGVVGDSARNDVAPGDAAQDQIATNPCAPGTCRFQSNPSGPCLPPGGPIALPDSGPSLSGCCACGNDGFCSSECACASPDTPIATPSGERPIASLSIGDLVLSIHQGRLAAVPIRETHRTFVTNHRVIEVVLSNGAALRISAAHPTADGRSFGQLRAGDWLGGEQVTSVNVVAYPHEATYDILPDSDTGTYVAGGALIGTTLSRPQTIARSFTEACALPPSIVAH